MEFKFKSKKIKRKYLEIISKKYLKFQIFCVKKIEKDFSSII